MMEFQVKFCLHSGLRLWRTDMLLSTKSKCHKSKFRISWMYTYSLYDLKVHFWCPNKCLVSLRSSLNTLYLMRSKLKSHSCMNSKVWTMKTFNPSLENLFQWATVLLVEPFLPFVFCTWCLNLKKSGVEYLLLQTVYKRTILPVLYNLWIQYKNSKTSFVKCCLEILVLLMGQINASSTWFSDL